MTEEEIYFFSGKEGALPIYEELRRKITELGGVKISTKKTQITFANRHGFAFVSFLPVKKAKDRPKDFITLTFGSWRKIESPRIDAAVEPYPNRWTHHLILTSPEDVDGQVMEWLTEAADFAAVK